MATSLLLRTATGALDAVVTVPGSKSIANRALACAALAVSSLSTPVLAQSAAPLSIAARSGAVTKNSNELYNSYVLPAAVIIAVLAAAILLSNHHHNDISNSP